MRIEKSHDNEAGPKLRFLRSQRRKRSVLPVPCVYLAILPRKKMTRRIDKNFRPWFRAIIIFPFLPVDLSVHLDLFAASAKY